MFFYVLQDLLLRIQHIFQEKFGIQHDSVILNHQFSYFATLTNLTNEFSERFHNLHSDDEIENSIVYSVVIFLSTFRKDFVDGKFIFVDEGINKKIKNSLIEGKVGRVLGFTSGRENLHKFSKIQNGTIRFLKLFYSRNRT